MKKIKIGQIGIGHNHGQGKMLAVRKFPEMFEVVGYSESDENHIKERSGYECYKGLQRMSEEELLKKCDAILVECDVWNLTKTAQKCIDAGVHIHVDKPASGNLSEFEALLKSAKEKNLHPLDYLSKEAEKQAPGQHGLIALDWFSGNRSVLMDSDLTGMILGFNMTTTTVDIYRALVEAIAFGTRKIIDNYNDNSVPINRIYACGSLSKNDFIMQVYADVIGTEIGIIKSKNGTALGSAIYAAAIGLDISLEDACKKCKSPLLKTYYPNFENKKIYDKIYSQYTRLHDLFGKDQNSVMKEIIKIKKESIG